jgi:hypothetical protein
VFQISATETAEDQTLTTSWTSNEQKPCSRNQMT